MMNLRNVLLASAALAAFAVPRSAPAQQASGLPAAHAHHHAGFMRMLHSLDLSDQQKAQMKTMVQQFRQTHPEGSQPDPQARKQLRRQLLGVLTPGQKAQVRVKMKARRERRLHKRQHDRFSPSPSPSPEETAQP